MSTLSQTNIKINDIDLFITELQRFYRVGKIETLDQENDWWYYSKSRNRTIIVSQHYNTNWIEVKFDFYGSLYVHDEFLRRLSDKYQTQILLGYEQTTSGDVRIAEFRNGRLDISIAYKCFEKLDGDDGFYFVDTFGVDDELRKSIKLPTPDKAISTHALVDWKNISKFFDLKGYTKTDFDRLKDEKYIHIEVINDYQYLS